MYQIHLTERHELNLCTGIFSICKYKHLSLVAFRYTNRFFFYIFFKCDILFWLSWGNYLLHFISLLSVVKNFLLLRVKTNKMAPVRVNSWKICFINLIISGTRSYLLRGVLSFSFFKENTSNVYVSYLSLSECCFFVKLQLYFNN